jgi:hypothetical protein
MPPVTDHDPHYRAAFAAVDAVADVLRQRGLSGAELWQTLFSAANDLRAADFEGRRDEYRAEIEAQRDALQELLDTWAE